MRYLLSMTGMETSLDSAHFAEKDVRLFFAHANHVFLGYDRINGGFSARSALGDLNGFVSNFKLLPSGNGFLVKAAEEYVCTRSTELHTCNSGQEFNVLPGLFGYTLATDGRCITATVNGEVKMEQCTGSEDQLLDLRLKPDGCEFNPPSDSDDPLDKRNSTCLHKEQEPGKVDPTINLQLLLSEMPHRKQQHRKHTNVVVEDLGVDKLHKDSLAIPVAVHQHHGWMA